MNKNNKPDKSMRTAIIRVSAVNNVNVENEKLGLKIGDVVEYKKDDILNTLDEWSKTKPFYYYMIEHNENSENIHFHIVIEFKNKSQCRFSTLKFKFPYGHIDTCRFGVHACVRYLTHIDHPAKFQYSWDEVITNSISKLEKYKQNTTYSENLYVDKIVEQICSGVIKEYQIPEKIEPSIYVKHKSTIMNAIDFYIRKHIANPDRNLTVWICQGKPRVGKSLFAKIWAKKHNKSICFSSGSRDPWQDYKGQDVFVFDDFNFEGEKIEDYIKIFDPHNNTTVNSRYRNKNFLGDTIIICTNTPTIEWFSNADDLLREALFKRISYVLDFEDFKMIYPPENKTACEDGMTRYSVNRIANLSSERDEDIREVYRKKYKVCSGRFLKCVEVEDEYFSCTPVYHYFDLKKYIAPPTTSVMEEKDKEFIEDISEI